MKGGARGLLGACLLLFWVACASSGPPPAASRSPDFVRRVAPFAVADSSGAFFDHPFLGGFDVPRPQLVDIDRDGDLDLFVQEAGGEVMRFERLPGSGVAFAWREDRFEDLDVGEWYRFADLDGDGDADLLAERRFNAIQAWEDRGPTATPRFAAVADTVRDAEGRPVYADRQNIPNVVDLDCDGLLDLMLGRVDGTVTRYEATAPWTGEGAPGFGFVTDEFADIRIVAQITPSMRHGANTLVFADADGDGDRDLFWGDFFEPGLLLLENQGSCESPAYTNEPLPWPVGAPIATSGYNAPTFGDTDGDGDEDVIMGVLGGAYNPVRTSADNLYLLRRDSSGWTVATRRLIGQIDVGSESAPAVGDLDGDGDLDVLLANKIDPRDMQSARVYLLDNGGASGFRIAGSLAGVQGAFHFAPALGDVDQDGDLDLAMGSWNEGVRLWRNEGTARAAAFAAPEPLVELTRGSHATPALADLDGDGDLDLVAGESSGELNLWRNDGTPRAPRFTLVTDRLLDLDAGRRSAPAAGDLDGDGDLDLLVGSESDPGVILWNEGDFRFTRESRTIALPPTAAPAFADLDGDGDLDLLVGNLGGGLQYHENVAVP